MNATTLRNLAALHENLADCYYGAARAMSEPPADPCYGSVEDTPIPFAVTEAPEPIATSEEATVDTERKADSELVADDILGALREATEPLTVGQIRKEVTATEDEYSAIDKHLKAFVADGTVTKTGERRGVRYAIAQAVAAE